MTTIKVDGIGKIIVADTGRLEEQTGGGFRRYRKVSFVYANGGTVALSIGSAWFDNRTVKEHYSLFDTVSSALSYLDTDTGPCYCPPGPGGECVGTGCGDGTGDGEEWMMATAIPVGTVKVTRDAYRVTSDGVTSDRTDGKQSRETLKVTRFYAESPAEALTRALRGSVYFEDAGTFDAYSGDDTVWRTVPVRDTDVSPESEHRHGEAWIEHTVSLSGELVEWIPGIVADLKESGGMWR